MPRSILKLVESRDSKTNISMSSSLKRSNKNEDSNSSNKRNRMYHCDCGMSFIRREHLQRHARYVNCFLRYVIILYCTHKTEIIPNLILIHDL